MLADKNSKKGSLMNAIDRKIAMVTGAGTGIGRAVSLKLLKDGWTVILTGRRQDSLFGTVDLAGEHRNQAIVIASDVTDPYMVKSLFREALKRCGRLDLLFNNAGASSPPLPLEDLTYEQWKSVVDVNLTGVFLCTQEAFKIMKAQSPRGGRIINNGSISATAPRPNSAPYTATKHAITGLTKATSLDGRKYDIACGQIDIGNAATDMTTKMAEGIVQADGRIASEPRMDVDHVASSVVHMANLPLDANVLFMTVMATKMPLVGRG
jgi:NAD(P)-dependent dehydrogenase (short-subunit alcohol dehydrogenase family)